MLNSFVSYVVLLSHQKWYYLRSYYWNTVAARIRMRGTDITRLHWIWCHLQSSKLRVSYWSTMYGADVDKEEKEGRTPLVEASTEGCGEIMESVPEYHSQQTQPSEYCGTSVVQAKNREKCVCCSPHAVKERACRSADLSRRAYMCSRARTASHLRATGITALPADPTYVSPYARASSNTRPTWTR